MNKVLENLLTRRSIRKYQPKQIKVEELETILLAGSYAPSGMGMQSWKFTAIQNELILKEVNQTIRLAILNNQNRYTQSLIEKAADEKINFLYDAPTYVLVSNLKENSNSMADSALALGNMMLQAHALGIGSCWLNQLPRLSDTAEMRELLTKLGIPENHLVYGSIILGYPDEVKEAAKRKDVINIIW